VQRNACVGVLLQNCNQNWSVSADVNKTLTVSNLIKMRLAVLDLSHADGQTDMAILIGALFLFLIASAL
jgi:hypothetical protein